MISQATIAGALRVFTHLLLLVQVAYGQSDSTVNQQNGILQDDPSNVFTRVELFNEYQTSTTGDVVNVTTARGIMAIGKRFTTRVEIPYLSLPRTMSTEATSGIGDVSARLLGYRILKSRSSALLASVEVSFPTAQSPMLGFGRYLITPVVAYSIYLPNRKAVLAFTYQEYFSFGGDESRAHVRWTRMQMYHIRPWSRRIWTLIVPELYYDHSNTGFSMNVEATGYYRTSNRFAVWLKGGAGLFGEHPARYAWTVEVGVRHLIWRRNSLTQRRGEAKK